jgi:3',5'-cyclic AMP phosphodiesterase CpdA
MLIAQISDAHIKARGKSAYRVVDTASCLRHCIGHIIRSDPQPDVVLFTGDLTDGGTPEEFEHVRDILRPLAIPCFAIPGNHDDRAAMLTAMPENCWNQPGTEFIQYAIEDYPVRLVGLDTLIPNSGNGSLCDWRLGWLESTLATRPNEPTILFMHHPPFSTGIGHMDALGLLEGQERFADIVSRNRQIERIVCGHVHRPVSMLFHGTMATISPSTAHQTVLDLRVGGPDEFVLEPPGYNLHNWLPGIGLVTHQAVVGTYPGPFPYYNPDGTLVD